MGSELNSLGVLGGWAADAIKFGTLFLREGAPKVWEIEPERGNGGNFVIAFCCWALAKCWKWALFCFFPLQTTTGEETYGGKICCSTQVDMTQSDAHTQKKNRITYSLLRHNRRNCQHNITDAINGPSCFCKMSFFVADLYFLIVKSVRGGTIFVAHPLIWCITGMMDATVDGMGRDGESQNPNSTSPRFSLSHVLCQSHSQLAAGATQWFKRKSRRRDGVHMLDNTQGEWFSPPTSL